MRAASWRMRIRASSIGSRLSRRGRAVSVTTPGMIPLAARCWPRTPIFGPRLLQIWRTICSLRRVAPRRCPCSGWFAMAMSCRRTFSSARRRTQSFRLQRVFGATRCLQGKLFWLTPRSRTCGSPRGCVSPGAAVPRRATLRHRMAPWLVLPRPRRRWVPRPRSPLILWSWRRILSRFCVTKFLRSSSGSCFVSILRGSFRPHRPRCWIMCAVLRSWLGALVPSVLASRQSRHSLVVPLPRCWESTWAAGVG